MDTFASAYVDGRDRWMDAGASSVSNLATKVEASLEDAFGTRIHSPRAGGAQRGKVEGEAPTDLTGDGDRPAGTTGSEGNGDEGGAKNAQGKPPSGSIRFVPIDPLLETDLLSDDGAAASEVEAQLFARDTVDRLLADVNLNEKERTALHHVRRAHPQSPNADPRTFAFPPPSTVAVSSS